MDVPVVGYSAEERETVILYDYELGIYNIHTNVPTHVTKCMKQYKDYEIKVISVTPSGEPNCIKVRNVPNAITFRNPKKREGGGNPNLANLARNKDNTSQDWF